MIVQVDVRHRGFARWQRFGIYAETVILSGNLNLFGQQIFYRMIRAVVAELQLEGLAAQSQAAQLMAQANTENRDPPEQLANAFDGVGRWLGVAGAVRKKDAVGLHREHVVGRGLRGNDSDLTVVVDQQAQDVLLDAVIVGDHTEAARVGVGAGFARLLGPRGGREVDRASFPLV